MDRLTHLIAEQVEVGKWIPFKVGRNGPHISHLMFADDLLLFAKATESNMQCVTSTSNAFCDVSGQMVSLEKTSIFFSKNVKNHDKVTLARNSGFKITDAMGRYLGVPLLGRCPKSRDYNYLLDKVRDRLSGWKAKHLSFAGRLTLSKSVIQAIPVYTMMTTPIPKSCLNEIQKLQRGFLWGDSEDKRRMHLVRWDTLTLPKRCGGLGIRDLKIMNQACLTKLAWDLRKGSDKLYYKVLTGKYSRGKLAEGDFIVKASDSKLWKELKRCWEFVRDNEAWSFGGGDAIRLWHDRWVDGSIKLVDVVTNIPSDALQWKVRDILNIDGSWNSDLLHTLFPPDIALRIEALPASLLDAVDVSYWPGASSGEYTVSDGYAKLKGDVVDLEDDVWAKVWKLQVPERVRCFTWQIMHGKLATKEFCSRWSVGDTSCHRCNTVESFSHVLRDCPLAMQLWNSLVPVTLRASFYGLDIYDWLGVNVTSRSRVGQELVWCDVWALGCYFLWWWRNQHVHDDLFVRPTEAAEFVLRYGRCYIQGTVADSTVSGTRRREENLAWKASVREGAVLNTDGAWKCGAGVSGCGGVIRSVDGVWLGGFSKRLHVSSGYLAELWGLLEGLRFAAAIGHAVLEVQSDSRCVVDVVCHKAIGHVTDRHLVGEISRLLQSFDSSRITHVYREANRVADGLANLGCTLGEGLHHFPLPPPCIESLVSDDVLGVSTPRLTLV